MYIPSSSASRARFASSTLSKFSSSFSFLPALSKTTPSAYSSSQSCVSFVNQKYRSLSFSSALRTLRCSAPRWSHGVNWRSPVSLRAQSRIAAPVLERFERKIASMGACVWLQEFFPLVAVTMWSILCKKFFASVMIDVLVRLSAFFFFPFKKLVFNDGWSVSDLADKKWREMDLNSFPIWGVCGWTCASWAFFLFLNFG